MPTTRIQLSRRAGSRNVFDTKIDRSGRWGNPHTLGPDRCRCGAVHSRDGAIRGYREDLFAGKTIVPSLDRPHLHHTIEDVRRELPGKVLGCWCALDQACHGDVQIEVAKGGDVHRP
jgi:hypothetical protein